MTAKGRRYSSEGKWIVDGRTGAKVRQITAHPSIHHHPFFIVPAYDDGMSWLFFVSHRTGTPQLFAEDRLSQELVQLTGRDDLVEWSIYPSHDGRYVYFTAGTGGWRIEMDSLREEKVADFGNVVMRENSMIGGGLGTTALSRCGQWWAVSFRDQGLANLALIDTLTGRHEVILRRDAISHMQFCPDDPGLIFYAGPLKDRLWVVNRDGSNNHRLHERRVGQWITHESWIPGRREVAFVDWPHGVQAISVDTGELRPVASFNAWHPISNSDGSLMVADTAFPDNGLKLFDPRDATGEPRTIAYPESSNRGDHWGGPFPYEQGPIQVYAPQHTHPHPSFSPDGTRAVFASDRTGYAQIYEVVLPEQAVES